MSAVLLSDLAPRWVHISQWSSVKVGLTFDCPCERCQSGDKPNQRLGVMITPIDPDGDMEGVLWTPQQVWQRTGETFATLTLSPSIDCSSSGHWHGFILNGEAQ